MRNGAMHGIRDLIKTLLKHTRTRNLMFILKSYLQIDAVYLKIKGSLINIHHLPHITRACFITRSYWVQL